MNQRQRGKLPQCPIKGAAKTVPGNKMPAQGALADGLKLPRFRDVV
jgi:hypothetical protein